MNTADNEITARILALVHHGDNYTYHVH